MVNFDPLTAENS